MRNSPAAPGASAVPDILIVVLDCVRRDLLDAAESAPGLDIFQRLRRESVVYPGCVAPGSWTIPSHASLFTGLYPWEHSAHIKGNLALPREYETLAEALRSQGYATGSFSANGLIQPGTGLTRGFDKTLWAGDREFLFRFLKNNEPSCRSLRLAGTDWYDVPGHKTNEWTEIADVMRRSIGVVDGINRVGAKVMRGTLAGLPYVAPWIEPKLEEWLGGIRRTEPAFAFVNLIEAHEPYLAGGGFPVGLREWLHASAMINSPERWLARRSAPGSAYLEYAMRCYARTLTAINVRIRQLVEVLQSCGRWDNTVLVITSDHGQSFWEQNWFGHRAHLGEPISRIPLWIRLPKAYQLNFPQGNWVSLVDVAKTAAGLGGYESFGGDRSVDLVRDSERKPTQAVYAFSDGVMSHETYGLSDEVRRDVDQLILSAYYDSSKAECSSLGTTRSFRVSLTVPTLEEAIDPATANVARCQAMATAEFQHLMRRVGEGGGRREYGRRLMAWGY